MTHPIRPRPRPRSQPRPRRLALLVASTAIAAGGVLVPTSAFATTPTAPHGVVADATDGGVHVPGGGQQWQCFAAPCEPPGNTVPEADPHEGWDPYGTGDVGVRVPDGEPQWQYFAAPCGPPSGARP
ncbi:hypothetical protein [Streptomyces sp. NBC_01439]|uniref:hypothetical protein n=1 Tax=Streptomyces sp. NBC_01439 TaxID=2903867 RepID=UPI002E2C4B71|nr:hypothetical protein [Streptomyces sp. NBC_01439]